MQGGKRALEAIARSLDTGTSISFRVACRGRRASLHQTLWYSSLQHSSRPSLTGMQVSPFSVPARHVQRTARNRR